MLERIYLHIGAGKTGTSSIQGTAIASRETLLQAGYLLPGTGRDHHLLGDALADNPRMRRMVWKRGGGAEDVRAAGRQALQRLRRDLRDGAATNAILSSETYIILPPDDFGAFVDYLKQHAREVVTVCYIRHPVTRALSGLQQRLKTGRTTLDAFDPDDPGESYAAKLDALSRRLGGSPFVVRPFERGRLHRGDVVADFFATIGLDDAAIDRLTHVRANESLSHEAVLLCDALNHALPREVAPGVFNPQRSRNPGAGIDRIRGAPFALPKATYVRMQAAAKPELLRLERDHGLSFGPPALPEPGALWGPETIEDIARLINDLKRENADLKHALRRFRGAADGSDPRPSPPEGDF